MSYSEKRKLDKLLEWLYFVGGVWKKTYNMLNVNTFAEEIDVTEDRVVYATENNSTFLECIPRSPQAAVTWLIQRDDRKEEVSW